MTTKVEACSLTPAAARNGHRSAGLTAVSWAPRGELTAGDWLRQGRRLGSVARAVGWWIGDWLRYGAARYGERYLAAARTTGYDEQTLMNMAYVASRFEVSRRRENLSFSHHAELAPLPITDQDRWLERAESEGLSVRALRQELRREAASRSITAPSRPSDAAAAPALNGRTSLPPGGDASAEASHVMCPNCGHHFAVPKR